MKSLLTILAAILLTATVWAQNPEKMSYQAVIRNISEQLVTNQDMGMQISILQGSIAGKAVYVETHSTSSNANGLVTIEIGTGTTSDDFSAIDWTSGPYFLETETDPTTSGGTNYTIKGISQLLSVPYAMHTNTTDSIVGGVKVLADNDADTKIVTDSATGLQWQDDSEVNATRRVWTDSIDYCEGL